MGRMIGLDGMGLFEKVEGLIWYFGMRIYVGLSGRRRIRLGFSRG